MSSRVRYLMHLGGGYFAGPEALQVLGSRTGISIKTLEDAVHAANLANAKLWVIREPRRIARTKSRYKTFCNFFGLGRAAKKKKYFIGHTPVPQPHGTPTPHPATGLTATTTQVAWDPAAIANVADIFGEQGGPNGPNQ